MKDVSPAFRNHLRTGHTSLARLWTVQLTNGLRFLLTDHDQDIFYAGERYRSDPGVTVSAIRDEIENGFSDATVDFATAEVGITEDMIRYNVVGGATFNIERVFYDHLEFGTIFDFGGSVREAVITDRQAVTLSVDGAGSIAGGVQVGEVYSERCRNVFGDFRCKVDLKALEVPFYVTDIDITATRFFMSISIPTEDYEPENPELTSVSEQTFTASGNFIVPECTLLSVVVAGGGGGEGDLYSRPPEQLQQPNGGNGSGSSFLGVTASGGQGGGLFHNGADGSGAGGDSAGIHAGSGAKGVDAFGRPFGGFGGDGGKASKSWEVGPGKAIQVGQQIPVTVGLGGTSGVLPGVGGFVTVYWRGEIPLMDDEEIPYGTVLWLSGNNKGFVHSIASIDESGLVTLDYNLNFPIAVGDRGVFRPGCNHYRSDCRKYDNIPNYRGEPDVPNVAAVPPAIDTAIPPPINGSTLGPGWVPAAGGGWVKPNG